MPTFVAVDNDPFAPAQPPPSSPQLDRLRENAGQLQQQLDAVNQMLERYRATRQQPAGVQGPPQGLVGRQTLGPYPRTSQQPKLTPVDHDPFAGAPAGAFTLPGDSAGAMVDPRVPQMQSPPMSSAGRAYQGEQEYQIAARQSTDLGVRDAKGNYLRPVLGRAYQLDDGNVYFDDPDGRPVLADKARHVVLRDPQTNQQLVFARTADTDQNKLLSLGQMLMPGMATGPVAGIGRGTGLTEAARSAQRLNEVEQDAAAFDRLGVRPFGPAFSSGPVGAAAKQITEVPMLGAPTRNALEESLTGARDAARDVASRFGVSTTAREAGDIAQQGIERFKDARPADVLDDVTRNLPDNRLSEIISQPANATSLKAKQAALYERAWRLIPEDMQRGRAVEGMPRIMSGPRHTRTVIDDIVQRNLRMTNQAQAAREGSDAVANPVRGGLLGRMIEAVRNPRWTANLQTLRDMRSEFRRLASGMPDTERNTLKLSDLERIQGAITSDMIEQLTANAGRYRAMGDLGTAANIERSIREFRRADQFTRLSMERLDTIERLFKADSAESLARNITNAALTGGRGNEQMLQTLRRTLRPEEMGEVAAAIISEMGRPTGSARGHAQAIGFSVGSFLTKWQNMSAGAKARLFDGPHREALDDLVRVASRLANVEALANTSRSFSNTLGVGSIGAAGAAVAAGADAMLTAGATAGSIAAASVLFSRPSYVRWVIGYLRAKDAARSPEAMGRLTSAINELGRMAQSDPALIPVYRSIAAENGVLQQPDQQRQQEQGAGQMQPDQNPERQFQMPAHGRQPTPPSWPAPMRLGGPTPPGQTQSTAPPAPFGAPQLSHPSLLSLLPRLISRDVDRATGLFNAVTAPARHLFLEGGWQRGPQDPQAANDMRDLLMTTSLGASAIPRPAGSVGAFGFGRGIGKQIEEEIAGLRKQYEQLTGTSLRERPRPAPGTTAKELHDYDVAYRDRLQKLIADETEAIQSARYGMPRTAVPAPVGDPNSQFAVGALRDKINANPFVQAIPGRRGFPTKAEQRALVEQMLPPPPAQGPWTPLKPVDPREMTEAEKMLLSETLRRLNAPKKPPPKS